MSCFRLILAAAAALVAPSLLAAEDVSDSGPSSVLVSRQLLEHRGLAVGDMVQLSPHRDGSAARSFRVAGVYEPVPDPMRLTEKRHEVRLHLPELLDMARAGEEPDAVDALVVELRDPADTGQFVRDVSGRVPGVAALPSAPSEEEAGVFVILERFHLAIALITVLGSSAFLLALMVMRTEERRETAGILRLLGLGRGRILRGVLVEGLAIALAGALFGLLFAVVAQGAVNRFFQWHYDTALVFVRVTPRIALRCVGIAVPLGILAGLTASWTLLRRDVSSLIHR